ncbi:hypothetical protein RAB80_015866 [Fusarium oxysporum f. sp. vasinfectum]|nr:hypothetical protein RAB80_015866 [Fusarium oxysporum f. sp. vasinfectum]KAK2925864.1 hypothetical protein FoTM2_014230 [Fusarium oxysporum f. sp. vasinfectum]
MNFLEGMDENYLEHCPLGLGIVIAGPGFGKTTAGAACALAMAAAKFSELLKWVKEPGNQTVNEEEPKSSMYPELHSLIAENLAEDGLEYTFRQNDQKVGIKRVYDTKVIGKFIYRKRNVQLVIAPFEHLLAF